MLEYRVDVIILLKVLECFIFLVYRLSSLLYVFTGLQRNKLQTLLHSKTNQSANIFYNTLTEMAILSHLALEHVVLIRPLFYLSL